MRPQRAPSYQGHLLGRKKLEPILVFGSAAPHARKATISFQKSNTTKNCDQLKIFSLHFFATGMIPSYYELLPMQRAHACLAAQTRGQDHRPEKAARPLVGGHRAAADPPNLWARLLAPASTSACRGRYSGCRGRRWPRVGTVWPSGSPPARKAWGVPLAIPHGTPRHTGARTCNPLVRIVINPIRPYCASS
jgi:hypothetical protein